MTVEKPAASPRSTRPTPSPGAAGGALPSAEREELLSLRNSGDISPEVMRRIERDLDLEESRIGG